MATFQIHEDIENMGARIYAKKYFSQADEKKITKKKFGEKNMAVLQPLDKPSLKENVRTKIPIKHLKAEKNQVGKVKFENNDVKKHIEKVGFYFIIEVSFKSYFFQ